MMEGDEEHKLVKKTVKRMIAEAKGQAFKAFIRKTTNERKGKRQISQN